MEIDYGNGRIVRFSEGPERSPEDLARLRAEQVAAQHQEQLIHASWGTELKCDGCRKPLCMVAECDLNGSYFWCFDCFARLKQELPVWKTVEHPAATLKGYQVWIAPFTKAVIYNITKLGEEAPKGEAGYTSLDAILRLKNIIS